MKDIILILVGLAIVARIWHVYDFIFSSWAKRRSKLAKVKYRQILEGVRRRLRTEEVATKTDREAIERQKLQREAEMAATFQSLQERTAAADAELDKLFESVSDPEAKAKLRRELDAILAPLGVLSGAAWQLGKKGYQDDQHRD